MYVEPTTGSIIGTNGYAEYEEVADGVRTFDLAAGETYSMVLNTNTVASVSSPSESDSANVNWSIKPDCQLSDGSWIC